MGGERAGCVRLAEGTFMLALFLLTFSRMEGEVRKKKSVRGGGGYST